MGLKGVLSREAFNSRLLQGNPAGEAAERPLTVYIPDAAGASAKSKYPVIYYLPGWLGAGRTIADWRPFKESFIERHERLVAEAKMPPCVIVAVDLFTSYGGSQYINSSLFGPHGDHIVQELIPHIEQNYPVKPGAANRVAMGKSSGGFGAMRLATDYPGEFAAIGCHSGDVGFEIMFGGDFVTICDQLARYEYNPKKFYEYAKKADKLSSKDLHVLMLLGNSGFYSPDPKSPFGYHLPIDLYNGALNKKVIDQWKTHDPLNRVEGAKAGLKKLKCLYLECGTKDQYHLLYGTRQLHAKLDSLGVKHQYFEFDDDHSGIEYRYDTSLPILTNGM